MSPFEKQSRDAGFSLLEAMVGLSILAMVLLGGMGILALQPVAEERMAAHGEALRAMEGVLEEIRSGADIPAADSPITRDEDALDPGLSARELTLWVAAEAAGAEELRLFDLRITARYRVRGQTYERHLESRVWRP